jgi:hypothetical protein
MKKIVLGLMTGAVCLGCGPLMQEGGSVASDFQDLGLSVAVDQEMPPMERQEIRMDFEFLSELEVDGSGDEMFQRIFSGNDGSAVLRYVDERLNFILPDEVDLESRIFVSQILRPILPIGLGQWSSHEGPLGDPPRDSEEGDVEEGPQIGATNIGVALWFVSEALRPERLSFEFGEDLVKVDSPRVGIIMLGPGFSPRLNRLSRAGIFVHEARHSDCTGGLPVSDLERIAAGLPPLQESCGHSHAICPAGHDYAGLPACDQHAWGAYAVQNVFFKAVLESCDSCSEEERQIALAEYADSASRILVLDEMLAGELGPPDMSSSGVQR